MKKHIIGIILACLMLSLVSCASTGVDKSVQDSTRAMIENGKYQDALSAIIAARPDYKENDQILYCMDAAIIYFYNGDYDKALEFFELAEDGFKQYRAMSFSEETASLLTNDWERAYRGTKYEDVYINCFKALIYYLQGSLDDALVEMRQAEIKIQDYGRRQEEEETGLEKLVLAFTPDPFANLPKMDSQDFYKTDLLAYLMMVLFREEGGDFTSINYNRLLKEFGEGSKIFAADDMQVPQGMARVNMLAFGGQVALVEEQNVRASASNFSFNVAWPQILGTGDSQIARIEVSCSNGDKFVLGELEDISLTAKQVSDLDVKTSYLRSFYRGYMKMQVATIAADKAYEVARQAANKASSSLGPFGNIAYNAAMKAADATRKAALKGIDETEKADTRQCKYLPDSAYAGGLTLKPGTYDFTVTFYDGNNNVLNQQVFANKTISENAANIIMATCGK